MKDKTVVMERDAELVLTENKIELLKEEVRKLETTKDAIQAEIDRKSTDYSIYISSRDQDLKTMRQSILSEQEQMLKDKAEFMVIMENFKKEKASFSDFAKTVETQNKQYEAKLNNVRQFIIAVQRAYSVIA